MTFNALLANLHNALTTGWEGKEQQKSH